MLNTVLKSTCHHN